MKWILVAMIFVNIGFAVWAANREIVAPESPSTAATLPGHVNRLLLLSEFDDNPLRERAGKDSAIQAGESIDSTGDDGVAQQESSSRTEICFSVDPLSTTEEVDQIGEWLASRGGMSTLREDERREVSRFWVYFPPFENRDVALARVQQMQNDQIDDIYVIHRGDKANAISLGLYSHRESLDRRLSELREKGYEPSIERRYETKISSWFDVAFPAGITFSTKHFVSAFPNVEATEASCT